MDLAGWSYVAGGNPVDRRKAELTRYFGFGLAGDILFLQVVFIFELESCFAVIG